MLSETIKRTRMYSGITQAEMAKELLMSESKYNRKENGKLRIGRHEAMKMAKLLGLNDDIVLKYWMADKIYELMKQDKELLYDAFKIVETHFDDYETCIEVPKRNKSFSSIEERKTRRRTK